jgi:hypothetical protein
MTTKRIIAIAAGIGVNPYDTPQTELVQGLVGWNFSPPVTEIVTRGTPPEFIPIVWDALVDETFVPPLGYLILYEATMADDGAFTIITDFFTPFLGLAPHTWAGWPIPGESVPPPLPLLPLIPIIIGPGLPTPP